jgi:DNA-binding NarL/FixJ family response regulator
MKPRLLLADDHPIVLSGLQSMLETTFDLVGTASDGRSLVDQAIRLKPDVILADITMPVLNGIDALVELRRAEVDAKVVFLTMHADATYAGSALQAGASGFVLKHEAAHEVVEALQAALRGRRFLSREIAEALEAVTSRQTHDTASLLGRLSPRQREVLKLLARGKSAKEVAALLGISPRTAEFHKYRIMDILNVNTSAELVAYALRHELL